MPRHSITILAKEYLYETGRPYAEILERGVHRSRRVKLFKARPAADASDVYYKACEWARAQGYAQVTRSDEGWFSVWSKAIG